MRSFSCILLLLAIAVCSRADSAWEAMQQGLRDYAAGNFAGAATNFDAAGMAAAKEQFDPAVPAFNRANALMKSGNAKDAAHVFEEAARTSDLGLQGKAYHNRGNALLGIASGHEQAQKFDEAIKSVDEALTMYERSMMLNAKDRDPKLNYELATLKRQELEEKRKQQQQEQQQNKDQNKDQRDQKGEQNKEQQDQNGEQQNQEQQNQQQQPEQQDKGEKDQQQQDQQQGEEQQDEQAKAEQMTPQEAAMLLDAMKQREQAQREKLMQVWLQRSKAGKQHSVDKDW